MLKPLKLLVFLPLTVLISCGSPTADSDEQTVDSTQTTSLVVDDVHSYSNVNEVNSTHLHLNLSVDFEQRILNGSVVHSINNTAGTNKMIFDIRDVEISKVTLDDGTETTFEIGEADDLLGAALTVDISPETKEVEIFFATTPESEALQWLNPQQTAGKKHPYLFTQGQAVLTRTWIPCQDTPGNRITYSADIQVPTDLLAVMSADNPTEKNEEGKYHFEMENPIPCYLIALAVGDLEFASLGERTGVYSEPSEIEKCKNEFTDVEAMVEAAEGLYGDYKWGRYDIIVLPPSFPFGGMENPKLTFATPTILAGDKSLVSLIAHELAHSWSGNLVTNATWDDFWLNEGFTVYFENRIMEEIYGKERADMLLSIEYQELEHENEDILNGEFPEDTHLKLDLENRNPDDGMTAIAYVKGAMFLKTLEATVGREKFDDFLNQYFGDHEFQTLTTEVFIAYLDENLLEPEGVDFNVDEWIYGEGIPDNCVKVESDRFLKVEEKSIKVPIVENAAELGINKDEWTTQEWMHFIRHIPAEVGADKLEMLDKEFGFSDCGNSEIMAEWYVLSIERGYDKINPHMEDFLVNVGRRKFLEPIYTELAKSEEGLALGREIYAKARPNYHAISFNTIDEILGWDS
ncbi:MAG: M1 family metallopeptidase [Flavobacteriales bacterium]|nr:M1 family metallopeptidase [Flavobacteriales bacterium]